MEPFINDPCLLHLIRRAPKLIALSSIMSTHIIDVRLDHKTTNGEVNIRDEIIKGLSQPAGQKTLPQLLLYDEEGLRIYDEITTQADEYYVFPAEETLLKRHANDIVQIMQGRHENNDNHPIESVVLELGAGYVRQLQALHSPPLFSHAFLLCTSRLASALMAVPVRSVLGFGCVFLALELHAVCSFRWKQGVKQRRPLFSLPFLSLSILTDL